LPSYKSVTEQAGIYAGKEGFDIKVENNTDLKGAVIASEAEADKNTLTTGTISFSDIKNEAEYDTKGIGMTLDANKTSGNQPSTVGQKGLIPTVPASVGDSAESTTKSGVSEGKINVTKPEKQKQDVNTLNRDTKNTLNKLDKIFDIEKIREDQETAALFGELAANGIHVLAEKNKWKNDDPEKIALHAAVGAVVASITKGNIASGALAGGATEYLANEILKACKGNKAQAQWVAAIIGAALSKATGGDAPQGAFVAVNAIKNNSMSYSEVRELMELVVPRENFSTEEEYNLEVDFVTWREMCEINNGYSALKSKGLELTFDAAQTIGGGIALIDGYKSIITENRGLFKVGSGVFALMGASDAATGICDSINAITGEKYEVNYIRSFAEEISPEYGKNTCDIIGTVLAISSIKNGVEKNLGITVVNSRIGKMYTNIEKYESVEGKLVMRPIHINSKPEEYLTNLDVLANTINLTKTMVDSSNSTDDGDN